MFHFHSFITFFKDIYQFSNMASLVTVPDQSASLRQNHQLHRNRKQPNSPNSLKVLPCRRSRTAAFDVVILIAVMSACGFLVFPSIKLFCHGIVEIGGATLSMMKDQVCEAPIIYASLGVGVFSATVAALWISSFFCRKCRNPNCRGLRKAVEFDIQLETEECFKNSSSSLMKNVKVNGLFELDLDHHRELKAELRKMAPPNGRAILEFRARCGCSVGRMEVPGPKKLTKIKK